MADKNISFEKDILRLEQIVRAMERGDITLEDSMKLFQEGTALVQSCNKLLDEAEFIIRKVMPDSNGDPVEGEFSHGTEY